MGFVLKFFPVMTMNFSPAPSIILETLFLPRAKITLVKSGDDSNGSTILKQNEDAAFALKTNDDARALARCR